MALAPHGFNQREIPNALFRLCGWRSSPTGQWRSKSEQSAGDFYDLSADMDLLVGCLTARRSVILQWLQGHADGNYHLRGRLSAPSAATTHGRRQS